MPAYFEEGFSVREPMWHGLGVVLPDYPGRDEAMRLAGHDFRVIERPIAVVGALGNGTDQDHMILEGQRHGLKMPKGWKALVKQDDGAILNVVRDSYAVVQNDTLWNIVDALVDQPNVKYETAGVLKGGAVLWVLALLDEPTQITGDDSLIYPYICASTTHDGSGACKASNVSIRVVCWNTYSAAEGEAARTGREFVFRHTKHVHDRIEDAKAALRGVRKSHAAFMELAEDLAKTPVNESQRDLFISQFIPMPPEALISERVKRNVEDARGSVRAILNSRTIPEAHQATGYGLFQAGIEYLDHMRGARNPDTYFGRSVLRQEPAKTKLANLIREAVA